LVAAHGGALALGIAFLAGQVIAWRQLAAAGVYLPTNPYSSFFFMLTGAHAVHLVAALAVMAWAGAAAWGARRHPRRPQVEIDACRVFWHFLLGVWIYLLVLVSFF
jgi:cytochrome c oxidase subunit 3